MNDRIRELSKEAFEYALSQHPGSDEFQPIWTEKFAELIVRECMEWCDAYATIDGSAQQIRDAIKKDFGVKE